MDEDRHPGVSLDTPDLELGEDRAPFGSGRRRQCPALASNPMHLDLSAFVARDWQPIAPHSTQYNGQCHHACFHGTPWKIKSNRTLPSLSGEIGRLKSSRISS